MSQVTTNVNQTIDFTENKISFAVQGMTCASCVRNVERALNKIEGVKYVSVNLATEKAVVISEKPISFNEIKEAVESAGYKVSKESPSEDLIEKGFKKARKNMLISISITLPLMVLMILHMVGIHVPYFLIFELIAGALVIFIPGRETLKSAWIALTHKHSNMNTLVTIGALSAWFTTVLALLGIDIFSFGTVATMLITINLIGRYIESRMKKNASKEITSLLSLKVDKANVVTEKGVVAIPIETVKIGEILLVRKGEKIPLDGIIVEGEGYINESMVSGEPLPVYKKIGEEAISGTILESGLIKIKVEKVGEDTFINQMIKLVEEAQSSKVPIQAFADRITLYFIPIVFFAALVSAIIWFFNYESFQPFLIRASEVFPWVLTDVERLSMSIFVFVATLVIACPCALGLATPMALVVASGISAKKGLIIKNGEAIQIAKDINVVLFDKTGTITEGHPTVKGHTLDDETYSIITKIEENSTHPLAKAIVEYYFQNYDRNKLQNIQVMNIEERTGEGIKGTYQYDNYFIGKPQAPDKYKNFMEKGETIIEVLKNDESIGYIRISDKIKEDTIETITKLKEMNIKTVMVTGDNEITAKNVCETVRIDEFWANVSPEKKVEIVRKYQIEGKKVCMVGDGINDAAALKSAEIGIAIGTGTDLTIESADVIISKGEISKVLDAIEISKATFKKIKQNLFWAFFYNMIAIPFAMMGVLHPVIAEIAMLFSSINVIYNSSRISKITEYKKG